MDVKVTQTEMCACGRQVISVTGTCALCIAEGAALLWDFIESRITLQEFETRLRV